MYGMAKKPTRSKYTVNLATWNSGESFCIIMVPSNETNISDVALVSQIGTFHLSETITWTKAWWIKVKLQTVPAVLCRGDRDERWSSQGEAGGSRLCRLCLWPSLAVVLLSLAEGQWRQLHTATREPPHCEGLQAGEQTYIRRQGGVRNLSKK